MNRPLKNQVKEYFGQYELTSNQLQELEAAQENVQKGKIARGYVRYGSIVAASLIIFSLIGYFWRITPRQMNLESLPQEIAYHHNKKMDSEIKTHSYPELKTFLAKLDFNLIQSKRLPSDEWELLGGRYCSLQGRLAAQIKIKNKKDNKVYTLYQLAIPEDIDSPIKSFEAYSGGAKVKIWSENDLLLGIAGDE